MCAHWEEGARAPGDTSDELLTGDNDGGIAESMPAGESEVDVSILLSTYWNEGVVFSADKNATIMYRGETVAGQYVEVARAKKVVAWPRSKAVVGFIGLLDLAALPMEEWMRQFIAATRGFQDLHALAQELRDQLQDDWDLDYPAGADISRAGVIVHLGGFKECEGVLVPAMYRIANVPRPTEPGGYPDATRDFVPEDRIPAIMEKEGAQYPYAVRAKIAEANLQGRFIWFNDGAMYLVFNEFKKALWETLEAVREQAMLPESASITERIAFSEMAVRMFGLFFEHHFLPEERVVGGGVDTHWIPWPD